MKILCFAVPLRGHVNPMLPLLRELAARGARVVCVCDDRFRLDIEQTGARFVPLGFDFDALELPPTPDLLTLGAGWLTCLQARLEPLVQLAGRMQPDVVVDDFMCLWGRAVARRLGLPRVTLWPGFALAHGVLPPPWAISLSQVVRGGPAAWHRFHRSSRGAAPCLGGHRLRPADLISGTLDSERHVVFTWPTLQPGRARFDARWHFVGPALPRDEPLGPNDLELLARLRDQRPVFVSLGTVFHDNAPFFRRCIEALAGLTDALVVSLGGSRQTCQTLRRELGHLDGARVHLCDWAPQLAVLERAALFVSHGGMNSVHEALFHRVPLIVHPQGADQFTVAHALHAQGLARWLRNPWFSPRRLRRLAHDVLDDQAMRRRVELACPRRHEAAARAAEVVASLVERAPRARRPSTYRPQPPASFASHASPPPG